LELQLALLPMMSVTEIWKLY